MKTQTLLLTFLALTSLSAHSSYFSNCNEKLDLDELYSIKAALRGVEYEYSYRENKAQFIGSKRSLVYTSFFNYCLDSQISTSDFNTLSSQNLLRQFNIINHVNFYSQDEKLKQAMEEIITIKMNHGDNVSEQLDALHSAYIRGRDIAKAQKLAMQHPKIAFSKTFNLIKEHTADKGYLALDYENRSLEYHAFDFPKGGYVVVISSPMCNPSKRFVNWLNNSSNADLKQIFKSNSLFITPTDSSLYIDHMHKLNANSEVANLRYAYNKKDWPEIKLWATPTFYFFYDGKLMGQLIGWPQEGREEKLVKALKLVNLLN